MTAFALPWLEDEDPDDLRRWAIAAALVVGIHSALIAGYWGWQHFYPSDLGDDTEVVSLELAPIDDVDQPEVAPQPEVQQKQVEETPPPPDVSNDIAALPEQKPIIEEEKKPPPPQPTPARTKGGATQPVPVTWTTGLVRHLQQYKRYPSDAQQRGEEGVVQLAFSVDRTGHVLSRRIVQSSGHADLDEEVMSMIDRAQPLPAFPPSMTQNRIDLTVPIRFTLR